MTAIGTGSNTGWTCVCGMPLTPVAMSSTALKQFLNLYAYYKVNVLVAHYITSAPTSSNGDVLLYFQKSHADPMVNWGSSNFLPFVMSDDSSIIGPQWTNQSSMYRPEPVWIKTDYLTGDSLGDEAIGDLFLFSKTSSTSSAGYVILDYEIEFRDLQLNIKNTLFPVVRAQWTNVAVGTASVVAVTGSTEFAVSTYGNNLDGSVSAFPYSAAIGDVYKCFIDIKSSSLTTVTAANLLVYGVNVNTLTVTNGFTCYVVIANSSTLVFYPTYQAAMATTNPFFYGVTATIAFTLQTWLSLVGSTGGTVSQANM